ncbi:hypothetical protein ACFOHW_01825 [Paenibacillus abyssi]|uniref:Uncharacterized protein n=1 Tax=Paenibacillus abyssi TaxID=1340531 RepID=A0A917CW21_9BACL|nr:hypothetical protein GCM10010916_16830 [Paenibacillus abyssi]
MVFAGEIRALVHDNHNNWATEDDWYAKFRFEGTDGIIKGTNGSQYPAAYLSMKEKRLVKLSEIGL